MGTTIVEQQNLIVGLALLAHHGCTYLTQTHSVAPAFAVKHEAIALLLYLEGRTQQMAL